MFNITIKNKSSSVFVFISVSFISLFHLLYFRRKESASEEEVEVECANAIRKHRRKSLTYTRAANSIASALDETNYDSPPLNEELKNLSSGFVPNRHFHG